MKEYIPQFITVFGTLSGVVITLITNYLLSQKGNIQVAVTQNKIRPMTMERYNYRYERPVITSVSDASYFKINIKLSLYNSAGAMRHLDELKLIIFMEKSNYESEFVLEESILQKEDVDDIELKLPLEYVNLGPKEYKKIDLEKILKWKNAPFMSDVTPPFIAYLSYRIQKKKLFRDQYYYIKKKEYLSEIK